ncbi:MAG: carboxypeptidase M32 [Hyphomicrobiales bacterium]|nr:carboxypeptidase M32 [Hyphomicrobiales bacterium]
MHTTPYAGLEQRFRRLHLLGEAAGILYWDQATMMPVGGTESRAEQLAELAAVSHGILTAGETGDLLDRARGQAGLDPWQAANLREMERKWRHATALSEDLVVALSRAASACEAKWLQVRKQGTFAQVLPEFTEVLNLVREKAAAKGAALGLAPYDALVDQYESGVRSARIDAVFAQLQGFLPGFLDRVLARQDAAPPPRAPAGPFPRAAQDALARRLMATAGFDFDRGRLDTSAHPFCGGTNLDVRITTRYDEDDFAPAMMAVLHETGHALYDMGLPADWRHQPVGQAMGMAIHESQSLLIEMQVCRSRDFVAFLAPLAREAFGGDGPEWEAGNLHRLLARAEPSFIRVDADEVTYPSHVILRYRLERAMIDGDLAPADLPGAWNDTMDELLGLRPASDQEGCLQDTHWFEGAFGYFPTYTLGAIAAAQFHAAARRALPDLPGSIRRGDFAPLRAWLVENVHGQGRLTGAEDLLRAATGSGFDVETFKRHLQDRYLDGAG